MEEEIWKDIEGYEGLYRISSFGNVFSIKSNKIIKLMFSSHGYHVLSLGRKSHSIHRLLAKHFIPNPENKKYVDHIDRNRLNNKLSNLRWVTHSENSLNVRYESIGSSKYKGVSWSKDRKKWVSNISINSKQTFIGSFDSELEAAFSYNEKAKEVQGEFAYINIIKEDFNLGQ